MSLGARSILHVPHLSPGREISTLRWIFRRCSGIKLQELLIDLSMPHNHVCYHMSHNTEIFSLLLCCCKRKFIGLFMHLIRSQHCLLGFTRLDMSRTRDESAWGIDVFNIYNGHWQSKFQSQSKNCLCSFSQFCHMHSESSKQHKNFWRWAFFGTLVARRAPVTKMEIFFWDVFKVCLIENV